MNFATNGKLECICGNKHPEGLLSDRRQFCRSCGCEVVAPNTANLDKQLSRAEIRQITRELRNAAIRASRYELPPSVTTLEELNSYLSGDSKKAASEKKPPPGLRRWNSRRRIETGFSGGPHPLPGAAPFLFEECSTWNIRAKGRLRRAGSNRRASG